MKRKFLLVIGIIALVTLGEACLFGAAGEPEVTPTPSPAPSNISIPSGAETVVEQAKADLAKRKGIDKEKIVVVEVDSVDWSDTSLGCPEPGMMYAQVITPGFKILLAYAQEIYGYHSDKGDHVVYCGSRSS